MTARDENEETKWARTLVLAHRLFDDGLAGDVHQRHYGTAEKAMRMAAISTGVDPDEAATAAGTIRTCTFHGEYRWERGRRGPFKHLLEMAPGPQSGLDLLAERDLRLMERAGVTGFDYSSDVTN